MDILATIGAATGCQQCEGPLGDSPSGDFCTESCQAEWAARRVGAEVEDGGTPWPWVPIPQRLGPEVTYARHPVGIDYTIRMDSSATIRELHRLRETLLIIGPAMQRALRLRRERNTGSARNPHARHGGD